MASIAEYIEKHKLVDTINALVNDTAQTRAGNPLTFMAEHLLRKTKPTVVNVRSYMVLDTQGLPSINVELSTHKGTFVGAGARSDDTSVHQGCIEHRDNDKAHYGGYHVTGALEAMTLFDSGTPRKLCGQRDEDADIRRRFPHVNQRLPMSVAFCKANAHEARVGVDEYIRSIVANTGPPNNGTTTTLRIVYELCEIPEVGVVYAVCPMFDPSNEAEVQNTLKSVFNAHRTFSKKEYKNIDCLFDKLSETGIEFGVKIRTNGPWYEQNRDKLASIYASWVERSSLLFIEDPFDETETPPVPVSRAVWSRHVASDPSRLGEWIDRWYRDKSTPAGVCIKLSETGLVTDAVDAVRIAKDAGLPLIMTSVESPYDGNPETVVDFAIGAKIPFLKIGRVDTPEGSSALNTLLRSTRS